MRYGHFDDANREYVIERPDTPRPWSNYLGSRRYGGIITNNAGGEAPTFLVMNPGDHATLNGDFIGNETQYVMPGRAYTADTPIRSSFPTLNVSGIPIFADYFCPQGRFYAINCKYAGIYISEDAALDFSGFYSLVPLGQIGQQGVVVLGYDFVTAKSSSGAVVYGFGGNAF